MIILNILEVKDGMVLEHRNGARYVYMKNTHPKFVCIAGLDYLRFDLTSIYGKNLDVVKIHMPKSIKGKKSTVKDDNLVLIWERREIPKLTDAEVNVLNGLKLAGYNYIIRNKNRKLYTFINIPNKKYMDCWDAYPPTTSFEIDKKLLKFIKWENKKPYSIEYLIRENEK